MALNDAGFSCIPQDIPVVTRVRAQVYPVFMETIHQKLKRLRLAKGLTLEQAAKEFRVTWQSVQGWELGKSAPARRNQPDVARVYGEPGLFGNAEDAMAMRLKPKEELLVMHFRLMNENQQEAFLNNARQKGEAGAVTRKAAGSKKKLRGVDDPTVARALRPVEELAVRDKARKAGNKKRPGRDPGAPLDDYMGE